MITMGVDLLRFANHLSFFFRREAGIAFVHTTIHEMLQIPRKLSVEKADKRQETYDTPL